MVGLSSGNGVDIFNILTHNVYLDKPKHLENV